MVVVRGHANSVRTATNRERLLHVWILARPDACCLCMISTLNLGAHKPGIFVLQFCELCSMAFNSSLV